MPPVKTIMFDNKMTFGLHELIAQISNAKTYYTMPYTYPDIGTIEHRNGVIRMFFPKKFGVLSITNKDVKREKMK